MHVQVCRWQSVAPEHRQQAVDLLRQAFPDMQGEGYADGYQSIPANWGISSPRKAGFFRLLAEITGSTPTSK